MKENHINSLEKFSGKRVLITGASGFIGNQLANNLCSLGAEVHGTSRFSRVSKEKNMIWWKGSFERINEAKKIFREVQPQIVFHMAGEVTASNDPKFIIPTYHSLLTSTINLLAISLEHKCEKIVLAGSCTEPTKGNPIPNSPYSAAKLATNFYGRMFANVYDIPVTVVRPFMGYGPTQPENKIIPHVILSFLEGKDVLMTSGKWITDWIFIKDLVDGILMAGIAADTGDRALDFASGNIISVREIVEKIADIMQPEGKPLFGALPDRATEHMGIADIDHTYKTIGWKPMTSLEEGLTKTIKWYKQLKETSLVTDKKNILQVDVLNTLQQEKKLSI